MRLAKWIIAAFVSYIATYWIDNIAYSISIGIFVWYFTLYILNRLLEF